MSRPKPLRYRLLNPLPGEDPRVEISTGVMLGNITEAKIMDALRLRFGSRLVSVDHKARTIELTG